MCVCVCVRVCVCVLCESMLCESMLCLHECMYSVCTCSILELSGQCWLKRDVDALIQGLGQFSRQRFILRPQFCGIN